MADFSGILFFPGCIGKQHFDTYTWRGNCSYIRSTTVCITAWMEEVSLVLYFSLLFYFLLACNSLDIVCWYCTVLLPSVCSMSLYCINSCVCVCSLLLSVSRCIKLTFGKKEMNSKHAEWQSLAAMWCSLTVSEREARTAVFTNT